MSGSMSAITQCCIAVTLSNTQVWTQTIGGFISSVLAEFHNYYQATAISSLMFLEILHAAHIWKNIVKVSLFGAGFLHLLF